MIVVILIPGSKNKSNIQLKVTFASRTAICTHPTRSSQLQLHRFVARHTSQDIMRLSPAVK